MLDFNAATTLHGVSLYGCHLPNVPVVPIPPVVPPPPPPFPPPPALPLNLTRPVGLMGRNGSFLSVRVLEQDIIERYLDSQEYSVSCYSTLSLFCWFDSFSIVLEFQTSSSDGLLLFIQDSFYLSDFFALQLVSGRLIFSFNLGSGPAQLESMGEYNNGRLHRVRWLTG